jgi:hypothetical protein
MANASHAGNGEVSLAEGWEECDEEWMVIELGLMSMGACCIDRKLRTIVSPGGSAVSWPPELGSLPCTSLVFICPGRGTAMVAVSKVLDLMIGVKLPRA